MHGDYSRTVKRIMYTVVFTGAGMSTESGLPDFRSSGTGLWNAKRSKRNRFDESIE